MNQDFKDGYIQAMTEKMAHMCVISDVIRIYKKDDADKEFTLTTIEELDSWANLKRVMMEEEYVGHDKEDN